MLVLFDYYCDIKADDKTDNVEVLRQFVQNPTREIMIDVRLNFNKITLKTNHLAELMEISDLYENMVKENTSLNISTSLR